MGLKPLKLAPIAEVVTLILGVRRLAGSKFFVTRHPPRRVGRNTTVRRARDKKRADFLVKIGSGVGLS